MTLCVKNQRWEILHYEHISTHFVVGIWLYVSTGSKHVITSAN